MYISLDGCVVVSVGVKTKAREWGRMMGGKQVYREAGKEGRK